jgi:SAM-dependent methyltransferase
MEEQSSLRAGQERGSARSSRGLLQRAVFWLRDAWVGAGRPQPSGHLDAQYRTGYWKRLDSLSELAPCMIIAGYVQHLFTSPRVLDIGCGHGRLCSVLSHFPVESYLGIDLSPEAVAQATALGIDRARFQVGDFETWSPPERFDAIVFQESVYYATRPAEQLLRYSDALTDGGVLIVSMFRYSSNHLIWRSIDRSFRTVEATRVLNEKGEWQIRILRPLQGAASR